MSAPSPNRTRRLPRCLAVGLQALASLCLMALASAASAADPSERGLAVLYTYGEFDHVDRVVEREASGKPSPGKPVLSLDNRGGEGKKVLTANHAKFVGAILSGFVKFPQAGTYQLSMRSNDGTRVLIDGKTILDDPAPHPDQDAGPASVTVTTPGWHPIKVYYFQKKGSWILRVKWSGPGLTGEAPIGTDFLAH